jgi:tRNA(fMet)-specific endonuclease VapC
MIGFLLDTNAVIATLKGADTVVAKKISRRRPEQIFISSIVAHELYFGAYASARVDHNLETVDSLLFAVLDFNRDDAKAAGLVRATLKKLGTPIGSLDVSIAGQALCRNLVLVTRNVREFHRVAGLRCENWQDS